VPFAVFAIKFLYFIFAQNLLVSLRNSVKAGALGTAVPRALERKGRGYWGNAEAWTRRNALSSREKAGWQEKFLK